MTTAEWRKRLKEAHLCRDCKKQDAYTLGGRTRCAECAARHAAYNRKSRERNPEKVREQNRAKYQRMKQAHKCTNCGRPVNGRTICKVCSTRHNNAERQRAIERGMNWPRGEHGYCWLCNKAKAVEGKRLCPECMIKARNSISPEAAKRGRDILWGYWGHKR